MTTQKDIAALLPALPTAWANQIAEAIISAMKNKEVADCEAVKECETLTSLSDFSIEDTTISITYTDENKATYTRSVDFTLLLNGLLDGIDPACLATPTDWSNMSWSQRMAAIVGYTDTCCSTTTTTTTP